MISYPGVFVQQRKINFSSLDAIELNDDRQFTVIIDLPVYQCTVVIMTDVYLHGSLNNWWIISDIR